MSIATRISGSEAARTEHGIRVPTGLLILSAAAGVGGVLSDASPTGISWADAVWCAAFSVLVVLACSRARRLPTVVLGGVAGVVAVGNGLAGLVLGVLSLLGALAVALTRTRERLLGGLVGLVASQALLRGSTYGFNGLPTIVAAAVVLLALVSAWRISRSRERRTFRRFVIAVALISGAGAATAGIVAFESRRQLDSAADLAEAGLDQLRDGDTAAAADSFSKAQYQFERASDVLEGPLGLPGRVVPVVAQNLEALRRVSAAGQELGFTASQAAATADWGELTATDGRVDLSTVVAMQQPVAASSAALDSALATVADVRSPWLLGPLDHQLDRLDERLTDAADQAANASAGLAVAPALLGADGPTTYLLGFATPAETRNAGGFIGSFATVTADGGALTIERTGSTMRELRQGEEPYTLDLPEGWNDLYSSYEVARFPGNISASPDWVTDADVAAQIYRQAEGGTPIDGVIYADPTALAALLQLTGPVQVPGVPEPLTSDNVERYLLVDQYVQYAALDENDDRKEMLGEVARTVFNALTSRPLPGIRQLTEVLGPAVQGGHLRVTTAPGGRLAEGDTVQAFLDRVGISGRFGAVDGTDLLSLRSSNLEPSKLDAFLQREVEASVEIDPTTGAVTTIVEVELRNDAPDRGLPDYILGTGRTVPKGTNVDLLTLYTPLRLDEVTVDGSPVGVQATDELGLHAYGVPVELPAGASATVTYRLSGPVGDGLQTSGSYSLLVVPQPLGTPDRWTLTVFKGGVSAGGFEGLLTKPLKLDVQVSDR